MAKETVAPKADLKLRKAVEIRVPKALYWIGTCASLNKFKPTTDQQKVIVTALFAAVAQVEISLRSAALKAPPFQLP